jgi:hypothetical protein
MLDDPFDVVASVEAFRCRVDACSTLLSFLLREPRPLQVGLVLLLGDQAGEVGELAEADRAQVQPTVFGDVDVEVDQVLPTDATHALCGVLLRPSDERVRHHASRSE